MDEKGDRRARELQICAEALDLEDADRGRLLERECAGDDGLRRRVEALIGAVETTTAADEADASDPDAPPVPKVPVVRSTLRYEPGDLESGAGDRASVKKLLARSRETSRYLLRGEVARGGMGAILRVYDSDLRRTLAMKVILGQSSTGSKPGTPHVDGKLLERFLEEAQVTGQLDHPGVVPVHELGADGDGQVYFTMRLVKGKNLREIIDLVHKKEEGWSTTRALGVVLKVCEAMAYAHEKGVVHRDLKPDNIMVGRFGEVYVMDWGVARVVGSQKVEAKPKADSVDTIVNIDRKAEGSSIDTLDGVVLGTPTYMPPEQARGDIEKVGPRSDVYSVGAMLYHLFVGRPPYVPRDGGVSAMEVLRAAIAGPPEPIQSFRPDIPPELISIATAAMARDPEERYASMMAMGDDLRAFLENRVVRAHQAGALAEFRKWVGRNKGVAASTAALFLVVILGAVAFAWQQQSIADRIGAEQKLTAQHRDEALANAAEARRQTYVASIGSADARLRAHEVSEAKERLAACDESLRGWEWDYLSLRADSHLTLLQHEAVVSCVAVSPDGASIGTGTGDNGIRIWDKQTGELIAGPFDGHDAAIRDLAFGPDGIRIVSCSDDETVRVWDVEGGTGMILAGHRSPVRALAFDPTGERIASGANDGVVRIWNAHTGETTQELDEWHEQPVIELAFSSDGARIFSASEDGVMRIWTVETGAAFADPEPLENLTSAGWSPDDQWLAAGTGNNLVRVWDASTGAHVADLEGHTDPVLSLAFRPTGRWIATGSGDKTVRVWELPSGRPGPVFPGHEGPIRSLAFAPDGNSLASASDDMTVRIWSSEGEPVDVIPGSDEFSAVAISSDSNRIVASSSWEGHIQVWDALSGAEVLALPGNEDPVADVAIDPAGERLVAGFTEEPVLRVWDAHTGELLSDGVSRHDASVTSVSFSPDGQTLASASMDGAVILWDARSGELVHRFDRSREGAVNDVAFSPDGRLVASASMDGTVGLWEVDSGELRLQLEGHGGPVQTVAFHPTDEVIATGSQDGTARLWNTSNGTEIGALRGHARPVYAVSWSPDGSRIVSGSLDKTLRVWSARSLDTLLVLRGHEGPVTSVAFSQDGRRIVSGSADETLRVWETTPSSIRYRARMSAAVVKELIGEVSTRAQLGERLRADDSLDDEQLAAALRIAEWIRLER